jgi:hypothetical protein
VIYYIYSPEKYKVYRIGITRVKDSKGLDNPYNIPYLEDRLTPEVEALDYLSLESEEEISNDKDNKRDNSNRILSFLEEVRPLLELGLSIVDTIY